MNKDRNCSMTPMYNFGGGVPMMGMSMPMMNQNNIDYSLENQINSLNNRISSLEKRVTKLENNSPQVTPLNSNYNDTNFYMM